MRCRLSSNFVCVAVDRMSSESRALQLLYHISFVMPLVNVLTWVRPLSRVYLAEKTIPSTGAPL